MTQNKKEKAAARALAEREGISYTAALRKIREAREAAERSEERTWQINHGIPLGDSTGIGDD